MAKKERSKSVINLSTFDYEKIAELQTKFDRINAPKCALKIDGEYDVSHIVTNMEQEKIQELKTKFENLNVRHIKVSETEKVRSPKKQKKSLKMDDFRKVRQSIEQYILQREMSILDKKRTEITKTIGHLKSLRDEQASKKGVIDMIGPSTRDIYAEANNNNETDDLYATNGNNGNGSVCSVDAVFRKVTKNFSGFYIWRIENSTLVPLHKDQYGIFYDKECYIIYAATLYGQSSGPQTVSRELRGNVEYHVHFWLGKNTTPDKAGVAAYKSVELDTYLGSSSTQHREVQEKESVRFRCYFLQGMRILCGETTTGRIFGSFVDNSKLYRVHGNRAPIFTEMPSISWEHFNSKDVFLLHTRNILFIWIGRSTNPIEKLHGTKAAMQLGNEYNTPKLVFVDDGYEKGLEDDDRDIFSVYLPLHNRQVKAADEADDVSDANRRQQTNIKLYHCCDYHGKYRITEIKTGPLKQEDLSHDDVIILDHGLNGIWVWVGKNAKDKERLEAIRNARGYVKKKKYPSFTPVTRVVDGAEPIEFKTLFISWKDEESKVVIAPHKNKVAVVKITRFDAITMHDRPALAAKSQLLDDGTGQIRMWRMKRFEPIEMSKERFGIFFTEDCYVILYKYKCTGGTRCIIYCWMGHHSIGDEQGVAALKAIELDNTVASGKAMHARVWQGKEPTHFLQLFKGRMRVFSGRGLNLDVSGKNLKTPSHYLLLVQGSATYNTRATQVQLKGSSLNSYYCYVLRKNNTYYIWCGSNSTGDNREMAKGFVGADFTLLLEGSEPEDFWAALCDKRDYKSVKLPEITDNKMPPRLFQCSHNIEIMKAEEILNFTQKDLSPEDLMLLDAHNTIYLWIGNLSTMEEHRLSFETAIEYLKTDPCGRDMRTPIIQLRQGFEPPTFTGFFDVWSDKIWKNHKSYEELRAEVETRTGSSTTLISRIMSSSDSDFDKYNKYSVNVLRGPVENLPSSVDPLKKELHLTYDDFVTIFCMEYKEFEKIPLWKQQEMKKQAGLF